MDLQSLRCFLVLANTLHFGKAAKQLNMTQPALSIRLKRLEEELSFNLFHRSRSNVSLSKEGKEFLPYADRVLNQVAVAKDQADKIAGGDVGYLRIGYTPISFYSYVPNLISDFSNRYPAIKISLLEMLSDEVEAALTADKIDTGFLHPPVWSKNLNVYELAGEDYIVAMSTNNPLVSKSSILLNNLVDDYFILPRRSIGPAIYDKIISLCQESGFSPKIRQEVTTSTAVLGLVAAGHGVGLVISSMSYVGRPGLKFKPISGPKPHLPLAIATRDTVNQIVVKSFVNYAQEWSNSYDFSKP